MINENLHEANNCDVPFKNDQKGAFDHCEFLLNKKSQSVVIIVPEFLPKEEPLSLELRQKNIVFCLGDEDYAVVPVRRRDILERLSKMEQVGIIESENGMPEFPAYVTAVADIKKDKNAQSDIENTN